MSTMNQLGKYQPYPDYKDSGVEWLGEIPIRWNVTSLKRKCTLVTGLTPPTDNVDNYSDDGFPWVRPEDISETTDKVSASRFVSESAWKSLRKIPAQSTLICCIGTIGKCGYTSDVITTNQQVTAASFTSAYRYYYYHVIASRKQLEDASTGNVLRILNNERLGSLRILSPSAEEAEKIATFLDYETARIDQLIAKQQQLIELLKEKRQAVISHAVTKGLNPNAPMKDSGVEWLGQVPEHWDVSALKRFWFVVDCKHITAEFFDEGIPLASIREVQSWAVDLSDAKKTSEKYYKVLIEGNRLPEDGDIIFSRNATVGEAARVTMNHPPFAMGQDVCLLKKSIPSIDTDFFMHQLKSRVVSYQLDTLMVGSTFKRINVDDIRNFIVVMPPEEEAVEIRKYLNSMVSKYRRLEQTALDQVALLQERRTALISAAVTGKIDLRGWQPPKSEVVA